MTYSTVDKAAMEYAALQLEMYTYADPHNIIYDRVYSWYVNTDITDPLMLAACAMEYGLYCYLSYNEMEATKEKYFG